MTKDALYDLSAFALAELIQTKRISSQDLVKAHIERIESVNPRLNAMVEHRFEKALKEAFIVDESIHRNAIDFGLRPLTGVPFTMKEMIHVENMKSTLGSIHRKEDRADSHAAVTERLVAAGAICLGTTNVPELGFWFECDNPVYDKTRNPFDLNRTPGGSSGGEAALIAAGASPFGIGSDIGGSLRIPASFCGIYAHKPSERIVPMTGHFPIYKHNAAEQAGIAYPFTVIGPMSRSAKDLYPLLKIIGQTDGVDPECRDDFELAPRLSDLKGLTVFLLADPIIHGATRTDTEISQALENSAKYLEQLGAQIQILPSKIFLNAFELWSARAQSIENRHFQTVLTNGQSLQFGREFINLFLGRRNYTATSLITAFLEKNFSPKLKNQGRLFQMLEQLVQLQKETSHLLGKNSVVLMPAHPRTAPRLGETLRTPFDFSYTAIINALNFPSTSVPTGISSKGLPLGIQIVANTDHDHLTLSVAEHLELAFGGRPKPNI